MKRLLRLAVLPIAFSVVALAAAQESETPQQSLPGCAYCITSSGAICWANYGAACTSNPTVPQCTYSQAYNSCAGWAAATGLNQNGVQSDSPSSQPIPVPNCTICGATPSLCWANYGVSCTAPQGISQCTYSQAYSSCVGWAAATGYGPNGPITHNPAEN
jgi:hypothetical protein